tara:strand:+ start:123 stop:827 length:705 start_codon:yes stop_codon:yes gene_type:complete
MKKLLLILIALPLLFSTCKKEDEDVAPQAQSLEDVIVGTEWCLSNANEDGFLLAEDGKFYLTEKCQSNTQFGNWIIDGDLIKYQFTDNSQEITIVWGEVIEYSESQIKLLDYSDPLLTITDIYILDANDIFGCTNPNALNYDPAATCDDASCICVPDEQSYLDIVQPIITNNCVSCHSSSYDSPAVLLTYNGVIDAINNHSLRDKVTSLQMPPYGSLPLSESEINIIQKWADCE